MVRLRERAWTYGYAYRATHMGTSSSMYKGALGYYKVYRSLYMGTSLIFLDMGL